MAVQLLLLRHGIAAEAEAGADPLQADAARPLTALGRRRTAAVLQRLMQLDRPCDRLYSSPLRRAWQTALLAREAGLAPAVVEAAALAPGADAFTWLEELAAGLPAPASQAGQRWCLVGHEPDLGDLAARLIGAPSGSLRLKKAGVVLLDWWPAQGQAQLRLLVAPKMVLQEPLQ